MLLRALLKHHSTSRVLFWVIGRWDLSLPPALLGRGLPSPHLWLQKFRLSSKGLRPWSSTSMQTPSLESRIVLRGWLLRIELRKLKPRARWLWKP